MGVALGAGLWRRGEHSNTGAANIRTRAQRVGGRARRGATLARAYEVYTRITPSPACATSNERPEHYLNNMHKWRMLPAAEPIDWGARSVHEHRRTARHRGGRGKECVELWNLPQ